MRIFWEIPIVEVGTNNAREISLKVHNSGWGMIMDSGLCMLVKRLVSIVLAASKTVYYVELDYWS